MYGAHSFIYYENEAHHSNTLKNEGVKIIPFTARITKYTLEFAPFAKFEIAVSQFVIYCQNLYHMSNAW